jgi:hypothetical protein
MGMRVGISEEGALNEDGKLHGEGRRTSTEGIVEKGTFKCGKLHGLGVVTFRSGKLCEEGIFENGELIEGSRILPGGKREEGTFKWDCHQVFWQPPTWDGVEHPKGVESEDVNKWKWERREGRLHTFLHRKTPVFGKRNSKSGKVEAGSFFEGDLRQGRMTFRNGVVVEEGTFEDGKLAEGTRSLGTGMVEQGQFRNGMLFSEEGDFRNVLLASLELNAVEVEHRPGCCIWDGRRIHSDRRVEEGAFVAGKLFGQGKCTLPNGEAFEGAFKNGELDMPLHAGQCMQQQLTEVLKARWARLDQREVFARKLRQGLISREEHSSLVAANEVWEHELELNPSGGSAGRTIFAHTLQQLQRYWRQ